MPNPPRHNDIDGLLQTAPALPWPARAHLSDLSVVMVPCGEPPTAALDATRRALSGLGHIELVDPELERTARPDTDACIILPDEDDQPVWRITRLLSQWRDIPILVLLPQASSGLQVAWLHAGASDVLTVDTPPAILLATLQRRIHDRLRANATPVKLASSGGAHDHLAQAMRDASAQDVLLNCATTVRVLVHEFKNALLALESDLYILDEIATTLQPETLDWGAIREVDETAQNLARASMRVRQLTTWLGDAFRVHDPHPRALDLNVALKRTLNIVAPLLGERIAITFNLQEPLPELRVTHTTLYQVLLLLLLDAIELAHGAGELVVTTRTDPNPDAPVVAIIHITPAGGAADLPHDSASTRPRYTQGHSPSEHAFSQAILRDTLGELSVTPEADRSTRFTLRFGLAEDLPA